MAVAHVNNLGTAAASLGSGGTTTITTSAAVAVDDYVVVLAHRFSSAGTGPTLSVTGGSLTWTQKTVASGSLRLSLFYARAPSGLAVSTVLTITSVGGSGDVTACSAAYTGIDTASPERASNSGSASTAAWATPAVSSTVGDGLIGGAGGDGTLRTSTVGGDAVERVDFNSATSGGSVTLVDDLNAELNDTLAGTWSGTLNHLTIGVAFIPAAGGGTQVSNEWALSYDITNQISREWALSYDVQNQVSREWSLSYDITNQVSREWSLSYDITNQVSREWALAYDVQNQIANEWVLSYNLGTVTGNNLLLLKVF